MEERSASFVPPPSAGFRFIVFGDQRAMADGEWQAMVATIAARFGEEERVLFVADTGDFVQDGTYSDQWALLAEILAPIDHLPYLVAVGNHEVRSNRSSEARAHTAAFLSYLDESFGVDRMYYRKDLGPVTFLFLDTNELVYGPDGARGAVGPPAPDSYAERQFAWLVEELSTLPPERTVIVTMHHPFVQSSRKHLATARGLWNVEIDGRQFPDLLADHGVDLVLVGHTHTYERFRLERTDGRVIHVVNVSGRPRGGFLGSGAAERRVRDIAGREEAFFSRHGFRHLERWAISQKSAMLDEERNQFALFTVDERGGLTLQVWLIEDEESVGTWPPVRLE